MGGTTSITIDRLPTRKSVIFYSTRIIRFCRTAVATCAVTVVYCALVVARGKKICKMLNNEYQTTAIKSEYFLILLQPIFVGNNNI